GAARFQLLPQRSSGVFICLHSDPSPTNQRLNKNVNNDVSLRLHNLTVLTRHIRTYYQDTLQQLIVMPLPNILCILLFDFNPSFSVCVCVCLSVCVSPQCERKEEMIEKIKLLDIQTQAAIVSHIQEVTHNQLNVLDLSWLEEGAEIIHEELEPLSRNMAASLRQLIDQRDKASEVIVDLTQERDYLSSQQPQDGCRVLVNNGGSAGAALSKEEKQHLSVELADTKAKLRRYRQELEEKTEQLMDSRHEAERLDQELQRLKQENQSLSVEARSARVYRDEVDSMRERAARVDRLETELSRCKEKLNDVHFYKTRVEELREDNLTLLETKVLLEEQLSASRGRCDKLHTLEKDNLLLRAKIHDLEMERDSERRRLEELVEENMLLEIGQKQSMNESAHLGWELEQLTKNHDNTETRKSLVDELNECVSSRMLKLEKENRELQASIERLKEENHLLQEKQLHTQELDRENQSLSNKLERLQGLLDQEKITNQDMEALGEELLKEKQSLERDMHALKAEKDRQISELESEKQHLSEAVASLQERAQSNSVARVREVESENRLLHQSITDTSSRLASLETQLKVSNEEAERLRERAGRCEEAEREVARLERSREALSREVASLRACSERSEALEKQVTSLEQEQSEKGRKQLEKESWRMRTLLEGKETELEEKTRRLTEVTKEGGALKKEVERMKEAAVKAKEVERENKELQKQATIDKRTLATLREELVSEKLSVQQQKVELERLNEELEKIGLNREKLLQQEHTLEDRYDPNASLQTESSLLKEQLKQLENQNTSLNNQMAALQRHTTTLQEQNSALHTQTAKLQVENSTLSSQSASLMAQNAVLQGQVTALETEVESWQRQREEAWRAREGVLSDHERLLSVHERQAHEYEQLISQHAALKGKQRALESEHRTLHGKYCALLQQKEKWEEHEGRGLKEKEELNLEIQKNRSDVLNSSQLEVSQCMAQYDSLMEQHQTLDLTMTKLDNHCELLSRLKGNLEEENHHLLSQINLLSQQNHALLERSMESKELYHQEQKLYIDKLNALRRQKEKLEEKIMDQYKFYDPTPKKRSQWAGAKALVKLIKPRKESSRERGAERERTKSAPDIPLPATPPLLPPSTPPPPPQRTLSDSQDGGHNSPGPQSPAVTPISRGTHTHTHTHTHTRAHTHTETH
uniref:Coiled-coil domain containing 88C n=1 Tax=Astatotilapia calliptera TaxID=8154 RepID=A0AAX7VBP2_ASTCA